MELLSELAPFERNVHTFKAKSHPFIIYACGFVCTPDNVKLITVCLDSFYSHHTHSGVGMLNKPLWSFGCKTKTIPIMEAVCCVFTEHEKKQAHSHRCLQHILTIPNMH